MLKFPVETLLGSDVSSLSQEATEAFYGRGWLLTHYLTFEPSRKGQLNAYLKAINAGEKSLPAARRIFGDLKRLDAEIGKYVMRSRLPFLRYSPAEIPIGPVRIRELSPGEDAMMELKIRSRRGVDLAEAKELLPKMRKAAAPFPKDPAVQATLAEAEFDARNYAEAKAAADRALAADPKHVDALVYEGRALMAKATAAKASDAATWREVRRWFATANKADPEDAEPLFFYYDSYNAQGIPPTRIAAAGLLKAFDLVPQDRGLRMLVARQYLIDGKAEEARSALRAVAYDPHGGELGKAAATLLAILEKGGAKSALESLSAATAAESD